MPELQLLTQALDALTRKYQKAAHAKAMFVGMAIGKFQMLALTATATDVSTSRAAWPLLRRGLFHWAPTRTSVLNEEFCFGEEASEISVSFHEALRQLSFTKSFWTVIFHPLLAFGSGLFCVSVFDGEQFDGKWFDNLIEAMSYLDVCVADESWKDIQLQRWTEEDLHEFMEKGMGSAKSRLRLAVNRFGL